MSVGSLVVIKQPLPHVDAMCVTKILFLRFIFIIFAIMNEQERQRIEEDIVKMLKTVYDPEIPVDVYNLGLIYKIDVADDGVVHIDMTLTAPTCPASDFLFEDINMKVGSIDGVKAVETNLVFEPEWDKDMMSEEAKLELGFL